MANRKRVIFCTYPSLYSSLVLKELIDSDCIDVVAIVSSTRVLYPKYGQIRGSLEQIKLSGLRYATYLFLVTDFFSWMQPLLTLKRKRLKTVCGLAAEFNIPILNTKDINQNESLEFIKGHASNYLLAAHFNQLIKPELLNFTELECINIHPSLLPSYKGVDPVFFAQLNQENEMGVTLHKMAEAFDTGEILSQTSLLVSQNDSTFLINKALFIKGAKLSISWMCGRAKNAATIDTSRDNYDSWPTPQQVTQFKKAGRYLIKFPELWQ